MKTTFMRPGTRPLTCRRQAAAPHRPAGLLRGHGVRRRANAWRMPPAPSSTCGPAAGAGASTTERVRTTEDPTPPINQQMAAGLAAPRASRRRQLQARRRPTVPALPDGQVLVRHHYLSLDPYMRGRMNDAKSYAQPQPLDAGDGRRHGRRRGGGRATPASARRQGGGARRLAAVQRGRRPPAPGDAQRSTPARCRCRAYLGAVGMPGVTAWLGW